jgi:hypothetical protein
MHRLLFENEVVSIAAKIMKITRGAMKNPPLVFGF